MILKKISSDLPSFRTVEFKQGLNIILADKTQKSSDKDSRNGVGKTTLFEIIHFCLGSSLKRDSVLKNEILKGWTFSLQFYLDGKLYTVHRNTAHPGHVYLEGDFSSWPIKPKKDNDRYVMKTSTWTDVLGILIFNLPYPKKLKYSPTFRSLISYFARKEKVGYFDPFKNHPAQKEWDVQVNNAFLLGLNWEYASQFQELKDQEKTLKDLKKAADQGLLTGYFGSLGELEAEKITLQEKIQKLEAQLKSFKVHPQYKEIEEKVNALTAQIHKLTNDLILNQKILKQYQKSLQKTDVDKEYVLQIYRELGFWFPDKLLKRLDEVQAFHETILKNRKDYLSEEMERLQKEIENIQSKIEKLSNERAELMRILQTHGALEEYNMLHQELVNLRQQLEEITNRIENLRRFEEGTNELKVKRLELVRKTRQDLQERQIIKEAIRIFNKNTEYLYSEPGILSIDVTENGYKFKVEIKRSQSKGVSNMKIFCYDLTLLQLRTKFNNKPGFLIHDSTIFDGVDERQIAKAWELAAQTVNSLGFQYIFAINSDLVPYHLLSEEITKIFKESIIIVLKDSPPEESLLGIRF